MPIVFISAHGNIRTTVQAMKAGAVDFLVKPFCNDVLLRSIRESLERSRVALDREVAMRDLRDCYASLTPREAASHGAGCLGLIEQTSGMGARHC